MDLKISYSSKGIENEDVEGLIVFLPEKSDTRAAGLSDLPENLKKLSIPQSEKKYSMEKPEAVSV